MNQEKINAIAQNIEALNEKIRAEKNKLKNAILLKSGVVANEGDIPTFSELEAGINSISAALELLQGKGESTEAAMSQKAISYELDLLELRLDSIENILSPSIGTITRDLLSEDILQSLERADTAIQLEEDPFIAPWAKKSVKPTYTASEVGAIPITTTITINGHRQLLGDNAEFTLGADCDCVPFDYTVIDNKLNQLTLSVENLQEEINGATDILESVIEGV